MRTVTHPAVAAVPAAGSRATGSMPAGLHGYWPHIVTVSVLMLAVVVVRLHEVVPGLSVIRPALLLTVGGVGLAWMHSLPAVRATALRNRVLLALALYFGWATLTVPFALWRGGAYEMLMAFVPVLLLVLGILLCPPSRQSLDRLLSWLVLTGGLSAVAVVAVGNSVDGRLSGTGTFDPNDLASLMAMLTPIAVALAIRAGHARRFVYLGCAAMFVYVVMATSSRGGALALAAGITVLVLGFRGWKLGAMLIAVLVGGTISWSVAPPAFRERIVSMQNLEQDYNYTDFGGRRQVWARARGYIRENPVLGVGVGNFPVAEGEYCREVLRRPCKWSTTHNAYLQAGSELGLPGLALFLLLLGTMARHARPLWRLPSGVAESALHRPELLAALGALAAGAYFLSHAYFYPLFGLAGLIGLAAEVRRRELGQPAIAGAAMLVPSPVVRRGRRGDGPASTGHGVVGSNAAPVSVGRASPGADSGGWRSSQSRQASRDRRDAPGRDGSRQPTPQP